MSSYEFLAMLEGKIGEGPFFRVQSDEFTVCTGAKYDKRISNSLSQYELRISFKLTFVKDQIMLDGFMKG